MARIRTVHPADMVAHLWAHKSQEYARVSGTGNFYFNGDTIYSYGSHFRSRATSPARAVARFSSPPVAIAPLNRRVTSVWWRGLPTLDRVSRCRRDSIPPAVRRVSGAIHGPCSACYAKARQRKPEILAGLRDLVSAS